MESSSDLKNILEPGESVIWSEKPHPWFYVRPTFMLYIVALPWTIFTFFWLKTITGGFEWPRPALPPMPWWTPWVGVWTGLILLITGIWMLSAPFWVWRRAMRTIHVVTDRRAIVVDTTGRNPSNSLYFEGKTRLTISQPESAVSDLTIASESGKGILFRAVSNPAEVVRLLEN